MEHGAVLFRSRQRGGQHFVRDQAAEKTFSFRAVIYDRAAVAHGVAHLRHHAEIVAQLRHGASRAEYSLHAVFARQRNVVRSGGVDGLIRREQRAVHIQRDEPVIGVHDIIPFYPPPDGRRRGLKSR